jgi:hypothetical protein
MPQTFEQSFIVISGLPSFNVVNKSVVCQLVKVRIPTYLTKLPPSYRGLCPVLWIWIRGGSEFNPNSMGSLEPDWRLLSVAWTSFKEAWGISKLKFLIWKKKFLLYFFLLQFLVIKTLVLEPEPDPDSLEMLDPYPDSPYQQHWLWPNGCFS